MYSRTFLKLPSGIYDSFGGRLNASDLVLSRIYPEIELGNVTYSNPVVIANHFENIYNQQKQSNL